MPVWARLSGGIAVDGQVGGGDSDEVGLKPPCAQLRVWLWLRCADSVWRVRELLRICSVVAVAASGTFATPSVRSSFLRSTSMCAATSCQLQEPKYCLTSTDACQGKCKKY